MGLFSCRTQETPFKHIRMATSRTISQQVMPGYHQGYIIQNTVAVVAHPKNGNRKVHTSGKHVTLAIGPEGGFIPYEINKLKKCGFEEFRFGERILPVETAVPSLISLLIQ